MLDVFNKLIQELSAGRPAVLGTIIRQDGSSPRSLGTKFLVCREGTLVGSIGGGLLESLVVRAAEDLMGRAEARVLEIRMTGKEVAGTDMICGGNVDVLVHAFTPENAADKEALEESLRLMKKGGRAVLAVGPLPEPGQDAQVGLWFLKPGGPLIGREDDDRASLEEAVRAEAERVVGTNTARIVAGPGGDYVLEPMISSPAVIIFGGGHISVNLAPLLTMVDFRVIVVDDRAEFASPERFPQASERIVADFRDCFDQLSFSPETYVVIVTRGHLHDKKVLRAVLERPARYVGMIGSRRKRNMIYEALLAEGIDPERIKRVSSPIGLEIGAETPEEIALSIAAELVGVRAENLRLVKDWKV